MARSISYFTGFEKFMFTFILVVQAIVAAALVGVILMQRSEGGGLGVGGSPSGFMSARGAADFLTRSTTILATLFVGLSIVLAVIASVKHAPVSIDTSLSRSAAPAQQGSSDVPVAGGDPLAAAADQAAKNEAAPKNDSVPLAQ
jgi:preprotein translocase subunit SecG